MPDKTGQQVGNYRLVRLLGEGGFAEVYLGQHVFIHMQAAIKILKTQLAQNFQAGFLQEAETIASLKHPFIIRIHDYGIASEDNAPYLIMEYAPHGTLRTCHPKGSIVPPGTIVSYVRQIASALQYAHDRNLIHRDLKPENLLVGENGEILLSDFGIAAIAQSTSSMEISGYAGTVPYSAPEQILGKTRPASDQYSLGIIVYEWLSGDRPFVGTFQEIISQHLAVLPRPLREKVPTIPSAVEAVIMRALAKEPHQRFDRIQAFATAFEQACILASHEVLPAKEPVPSQSMPPVVLPESRANQPPPQTPLVSQQSRQSDAASAYTAPDIPISTGARIPSQAVVTSRRFPRRTILMGLPGAGVIAIGSGVIWIASFHEGLFPGNLHTTPTSTPPPLRTTLFTYRGHTGGVNAVAWSPDGKRIASGSYDVQVWDAANGGNVFIYRGSGVNAVAWSPDGKRIASGNADSTVQVWDAANGGNVYTYRGHPLAVNAVAWSPDGKRIASGGWDGSLQVWDAANGGNVYTYRGHTGEVSSIAWSPDGKRIASGDKGFRSTVQVWDAANGGNVCTYHGSGAYAVAWSPDGKRIASGNADSTVQVWDAANGGNVYTYHGSGAYAVVVNALRSEQVWPFNMSTCPPM